MKKILRKSWFLPLVIAVLLLGSAGGILAYKQKNPATVFSNSLIFGTFEYDCDEANPSSIECHQKKYVNLARQDGIEKTYTQLRSDYGADTAVKNNCHQITHAIGREAVEKYKTIEAAYAEGDNFCWSGYYHGVMEAVVKNIGSDKINGQMTSVCAKLAATRQYSFDHFNCVHGMGHGLMAVNQDELFDVLKLCDRYTDSWEQRSCYGGAYMENIMVAIQMGGQSKYLKNDEPMYPCTAVAEKYKTECYLMQTSQALRVLNTDYAKVFTLCDEAGEYADVCYQSLGRDASGNSNSNTAQTISTCMLGGSEKARTNCFTGAVKDFISYYHGDQEAAELCNTLETGLMESCNTVREEYVKTL